MNKIRYKNDVSFIDLLFNTLLLVFFMFVISFLLINIPDSKKIDSKAEMIVVLEWPDESYDDIDLWMMLPTGQKVGFPTKHVDLVHLERDDRGYLNDTYISQNNEVIRVIENKEVITIRGFIPGKYVVNVHVYSDNSNLVSDSSRPVALPYTATIKLIRLNPKYEEIAITKIILTQRGQEETAFAFEITSNQKVHIIPDVNEKFVYPGMVEGRRLFNESRGVSQP